MTDRLFAHFGSFAPLAALEFSPAIVAGVVVVVLLAAGAALIPVLRKIVEKQHRNSHPALFRRLLALHDLSRRERQLTARLVEQEKPSPAGRIFVEACWFDRALQSPAFTEDTDLLTSLRDRLFTLADDEVEVAP